MFLRGHADFDYDQKNFMKTHFSDFFEVEQTILEEYGALNISLINDLPLFIDPFLLFNSDFDEYRKLHDNIIQYLRFLRDASRSNELNPGLIQAWFLFPEVKQNWLGYSKVGNGGSGLGPQFAKSLNSNLGTVFRDFGEEQVTQGSHLEKLCLIRSGVGRDMISDFTANLTKGYICEYTQKFAEQYLDDRKAITVSVSHVSFNYKTRSWQTGNYYLPYIDGDYVLLTPKNILTKDDTWINRNDLIGGIASIAESVSNAQLRAQLDEYLSRKLTEDLTKKERDEAVAGAFIKYPELLDYYIQFKEEHGDEAFDQSKERVKTAEHLFVANIESAVSRLRDETDFYSRSLQTIKESRERVAFFKTMIEDNDGYKIFYVDGAPVKREYDVQLMFRLVWYASPSSVDSEVNNGRGPVDYKIARGSKDQTLIEFKLASNTQLKRNLTNQVEIYAKANKTDNAIKVIIYFTDSELERVLRILKELEMLQSEDLVLIDARDTNKPSASRA